MSFADKIKQSMVIMVFMTFVIAIMCLIHEGNFNFKEWSKSTRFYSSAGFFLTALYCIVYFMEDKSTKKDK